MNKEDVMILLEMKNNCLRETGTHSSTETYSDAKRIQKANAITKVLNEINRLNKALDKMDKSLEARITELSGKREYRQEVAYYTGLRHDIKIAKEL